MAPSKGRECIHKDAQERQNIKRGREKRGRPRGVVGINNRDGGTRPCPAPRALAPVPQVSSDTLHALAELRRHVAEAEEGKSTMQRNKSNSSSISNVAFDPLDPIAKLEAARLAKKYPIIHPDDNFRPSVNFIEEERLVPVNYSIAHKLQVEMEAAAAQQRMQNLQREQARILEERRADRHSGPVSFMDSRRLLEEQIGKNLLQKVTSRGSTMIQYLRQLDLRGTGFVPAEDFRNIIKQHKDELGISLIECDRLTEEILLGDLARYDILQSLPMVRSLGLASNTSKSAADLRIDRLLEEAEARPQRYQWAAEKHHSTTRLLRPFTGDEAFFPDQERLVTTLQRPADECLSPILLDKAQRLAESKRLGLQAHWARLDSLQAGEIAAVQARERAKQKHLAHQRTRYLEPLELKKKYDQAQAERPRGKRRFEDKAPLHLNQKLHQLEQRIGEEDARKAYAVYETRTRTKEWQETFGIRKWQLEALEQR